MKSFTPQSNIYLTDVPWTDNYTDILNFSNVQNQQNFFNSRIKKTFSNYVYLKKDSAIKVEGNIDDYISYNYLFYKNPTTNKYYYCFITNMEYISENTTQIYFKTDVFQTWSFDIIYNKCFLERCHVSDDSVGANTVPEGLETGEYVADYYTKNVEKDFGTPVYILGCTSDPFNENVDTYGGMYGGVYSGITYFYYTSNAILSNHLQQLADDNKITGVQSLFMAPGWLGKTGDNANGKVEFSSSPNVLATFSTQLISDFDGYVPKNNKLFCYPYCYYYISNGTGATAVYKPELFPNRTCEIKVEGVLTPGCSIHYTPINYQGVSDNYDAGISGSKFPQCNWATDQFTNWLTQNSVNLTTPDVNMAMTPISMFGDLLTLDVGGAAKEYTNNYMAVLQRDKEVETHAKVPPQVGGNINSGDIAFTSGETGLSIYNMRIKKEFAQIIDDYFSMFGYQVNRVQQLSISGRPNWNYVKTINCNVSGNIPESDLNEIKNIFNNGVTCWHNINTMYDYTQNNK